MKFEIHSHEGAGPIRFGMTTAEVREVLGSEFKSSDRGGTPYDRYLGHGCFVYYDESGKVEAIEFSDAGYVTLGGVDLLGLSFAEMLEFIRVRDPEVEVNIEGLESLNLGIGSYAPDGEDEPESPAETVIVFRRGYYD
jgi:hypothetical protein